MILSISFILAVLLAYTDHTCRKIPTSILAFRSDTLVSLRPPRAPLGAVKYAATARLAATAELTEQRTSPKEVVQMFDEYASYFESKLVDTLEYSTPQDVATKVSARIQSDRNGQLYTSILDAGCGTGLSGPYLRKMLADGGTLTGVDLSPKMAELAAELVVDDGPTPVVVDRMRRCTETARLASEEVPDRLYDGVFTADLLDLPSAKLLDGYGSPVTSFPSQPFDLIVSADVLVYFGEMRTILKVFANKLAVGGDLVFSTETLAEGDYNWVCLPGSERYAHCPEYIARTAEEAGLVVVSQEAFTPRLEGGEKVLGTLHIFRKEK